MKKTSNFNALALMAALFTAASASSALAGGSDTFNRSKLGGSWAMVSGKFTIAGDQLYGKSSLSLGYFKPSHDTAASAVVSLGGTDLEYGAVVVGDIAGGTDAFVKIQSQNGVGSFDHAAFYTGNNSGSDFFALSSAVPSPAVLDAFFCGTVAYMRITSAAGVQVYSEDYGTTFGTGSGLGTYGSALLDNYIGYATNCTAASAVAAKAIPARLMTHDTDKSLPH